MTETTRPGEERTLFRLTDKAGHRMFVAVPADDPEFRGLALLFAAHAVKLQEVMPPPEPVGAGGRR